MLAEALGWSLALGRGGLSGLSNDEIQPETRSQELVELSTMSYWSTSQQTTGSAAFLISNDIKAKLQASWNGSTSLSFFSFSMRNAAVGTTLTFCS